MDKISTMVSNTYLDKHGERLSLSSLKNMNKQTEVNIISSHNEHDYRNPPIARGIDSFLKTKGYSDGELWATFEFFDVEDIGKTNPTDKTLGKTLALNLFKDNGICVFYDINHQDDDEILNKLELLQKDVDPNSDLKFELKKSLEMLAVIGLAISYVGKKFLDSFLEKVADSFWDSLAETLKLSNKYSDSVLCLMFDLSDENTKREVLINFTRCSAQEVKEVFENKKDYIYGIVNSSDNDIARIVFNYSNKELVHEYSVFHDGTPTTIRDLAKYKTLIHPHKAKK